jgi:hypothetical protein
VTRLTAAQLGALNSAERRRIAGAMKEDLGGESLEAYLREMLEELALWGNHARNSIGSRKGWPDWEILGSRIIHRELKSEYGVLRPEQRAVGALIIKAGGDWAIWRPRDLLNGTIRRQLEGIS